MCNIAVMKERTHLGYCFLNGSKESIMKTTVFMFSPVTKITFTIFNISEDNVETEQINCKRVIASRTCRFSNRTMVGRSICQLHIGRI